MCGNVPIVSKFDNEPEGLGYKGILRVNLSLYILDTELKLGSVIAIKI